jgi:hypothetical protein
MIQFFHFLGLWINDWLSNIMRFNFPAQPGAECGRIRCNQCFVSVFLPGPENKYQKLLSFNSNNPIASLTFAARKSIYSQKFQGNEQLRIDGDFYPCAF